MAKKKRSLVKIKLFFFFIVLPLMIGAGAGGYMALARGVPSVAELKNYKNVPSTKVFAQDDTLIGEIKLEKGLFVPLSKMPGSLINAVVAVEDSSFWKHSGIDYLAIMRAAAKDIMHRQLKEGGSTITQQLAKMTFLTPEKTIKRKLREFVLATKIEKNLTKEEILELYLNRAYFGHGAYGVEMASRVYFGKSLSEITLPEAALIAGLLKAPGLYSPYNNLKKAKERQTLVLSRMEEEGFVSRKDKEDAEKSQVSLRGGGKEGASFNYFIDYIRKYLESKYGEDMTYKEGLKVYTSLDKKSQLAAQQALQEGLRELDKRRGWRGPVDHRELTPEIAVAEKKPAENNKGIKGFMLGLVGKKAEKEKSQKPAFQTKTPSAGSISLGTVIKVDKAEARVLVKGFEGRLPVSGAEWARVQFSEAKKKKTIENFDLTKILKPGDIVWVAVKEDKAGTLELALEQEPEAQGAVTAIDPSTGYVRAMAGGYDYTKSEYNRAVYAERQAGSAFKPIVYALALDSGFSPSSIVNDEPVSYRWRGEQWSPKNYDGDYFGQISLRDALAYSRNAVTVKLVEDLGVGRVIEFAKSLGVKAELPRDLTIGLGSVSLSPLELTSCYSAFANQGIKMSPITIRYITDQKGRIVENNEPSGEEVINSQTSFLITSMLKDVVNYGTGQRAKALGRPVAGKTGTSNDFRDAWFVGYTPDLVTGVWVGFDDRRPLGSDETGARAAAPVWVRFMSSALAGSDVRDFPVPDGIVLRPVDPMTGKEKADGSTTGLTDYFRAEELDPSPPETKAQ